jgi:hypothetical protein
MPDNAIYFQAAYAATVVLYAGYALTVVLRWRALRRRRAERLARATGPAVGAAGGSGPA